MTKFQQTNENLTKKVRCWPARLVGIIGLFFILWVGGYAVESIPKEPKVIPLVILWSIMLIGGCIDFIRVGREGKGGLVMLVGGIVSYLYLLMWLMLGWETEGSEAAIAGSLPLFGSGLLFYLCGKRRRKLKE
jgi:hypothetical protein